MLVLLVFLILVTALGGASVVRSLVQFVVGCLLMVIAFAIL